MAAKTIQPVVLERETLPADAEAAATKIKTARIDVAQWLAELKAHPDLVRNLLQGVELKQATKQFADLASETRATLPTLEAAYHLNRAQQTLRIWAMTGHPIRPVRVNGRLAWPVAEIKRLLGVA